MTQMEHPLWRIVELVPFAMRTATEMGLSARATLTAGTAETQQTTTSRSTALPLCARLTSLLLISIARAVTLGRQTMPGTLPHGGTRIVKSLTAKRTHMLLLSTRARHARATSLMLREMTRLIPIPNAIHQESAGLTSVWSSTFALRALRAPKPPRGTTQEARKQTVKARSATGISTWQTTRVCSVIRVRETGPEEISRD